MKMIRKLSCVAAFVSVFAAGTANATLLDLTTFTAGGWGGVSTSTNYATLTADSSLGSAVSGVTSFDWFFQANDYMPFNDYGYMTDGNFYLLSDIATVGDYANSGWNTYTFGSAYTGYLEFGVNNVLDTSLSSQLHISNVSAVPEPETYAMLLAGLGLVGWMARRRKSNDSFQAFA